MSVLRYFSNYLPLPDKNLSLTQSVFEVPIDLPENQTIESMIPGYPQSQKLNSIQKILIPQKVLDYLYLKYELHTPFISILKEKLENQSISQQDKKIYSILTVRSTCCILFTPIEKIEPSIFRDYISALSVASVFYPQPQHINELFFGIFEKFSFASQLSRITEYVDVLKDVEQFYSDSKSNCLQAHLSITLNMIETLLDQINQENENLISNHFYFTAVIIGKAVNPDKELISKLSTSIIKLINLIAKNPVSITLSCAILQLMISLRKHIVFDCTPYMDVLRQMSPMNTLFNTTTTPDVFQKESIQNHEISLTFKNSEENLEMFLPDEKIKKFKNLFTLEDATTNPLLIFSKETGMQLANSGFDVFSNILDILIKFIMDEGLNIYAITIIIISQLTDYAIQIGDYFIKNKAFELVLPLSLFDPNTTSYTCPQSPLLYLQQQTFQMLGMLCANEKTIPCVRQSFANVISNLTIHSALFSDIMNLAYQNIPQIFSVKNANDSLWESVFLAMLIQQENFYNNSDPLAKLYRPQLMTVVSKLILLPNAQINIVQSDFCCSVVSNFFFESFSVPFSVSFTSLVIDNASKDQVLKPYDNFINSLHKTIWSLIPNISEQKTFDLLLTIVDTICQGIDRNVTKISHMIKNTEILSDIISIILNLKPVERAHIALGLGFDLLLKIQQVRNFVFDGIPFTSIAKVANRVGVDSSLYNRIVKVISGGDYNFDRIAVPEAIPLLIISTRGSKEYSSVLNDILRFCEKSVCNRCACIAGHLPAMIFEKFEEKDFPTILKIFELIATTGLNHTALIQFFRQFSSVSSPRFNNRIFDCIAHLANIVSSAEKPQHFSMVLFSSEFSGIQLPEITAVNTSDDFMVTANILVDAANCGRYLFDFNTQDKQSYLKCLFANNSVAVKYKINQEEEKTFSFTKEIPVQKFFNISLVFRHYDEKIALFIEDNEVETVSIKPFPVFPDFKMNMMLNVVENSQRFFSVEAQEAAVYTRGNWNISSMLKLPEKMNMQSIANWATEHQSDMKILKRFGNKTFIFDPAKCKFSYSGTPIRFFSNFLKVFEASHSINFIISLFGQLDFQCPNLEDRQTFFENLLSIVTNLIKKSDITASQMSMCHMYSVIAHFLYNSSKSHLTANIWSSFVDQLNSTRSKSLRSMLLRCIIFNDDIWCFAPLSVSHLVFTDWLHIIESNSDECRDFVNFGFMLTIFNRLVPSQSNIESISKNELIVTGQPASDVIAQMSSIRSVIVSIMKIIVIHPYTEAEADFLYHSIWQCQKVDDALSLLEVGALCIHQPWFKFDMFHFENTWIKIVAHPFDRVRSFILSVFSETPGSSSISDDKVSIANFLIASNPIYEKTLEDDSDKCFLTNCCRCSVGISERTSLRKIVNSGNIVIKHSLYIKLAASAMIVSPREICSLFIEFLHKVFENERNLSLFDLSQFHFLTAILLHCAMSKSLNTIPIVAKIVANDPLSLRVCIDALASISFKCKIDIDKISSDLVSSVLDIISTKPASPEICVASGTLALILMFHTPRYPNQKLIDAFVHSPFSCDFMTNNDFSSFSTSLPNVMDIIKRYVKNKDVFTSQVFCKRVDSFGKWLDRDLCKRLIDFMSTLSLSFPKMLDQPIFVMLSLFFDPYEDPSSYTDLVPLLVRAMKNCDKSDEILEYVGHFITRLPESDVLSPVYDELRNIFGSDWRNQSIYVNGFHAFNNYCDQPPSAMNIIDEILFALFSSLIEKCCIPTATEISERIDSHSKTSRKHLEPIYESSTRHWRSLWASISHERSPFFKQKKLAMHNHYKRFSMYDNMMRPILLKRNTRFDPHLDASLRRDTDESLGLSLRRDDTEAFYSLPAKSPSRFDDVGKNEQTNKYIWRVSCELICVDKVVQGTFTVTSAGYSFSSEGSHTITIKRDDVTSVIQKYVLQRQTAFEVYTCSRRSFLFNFPSVDGSKTLSYIKSIPLPSDCFVQSFPGSSEIEHYTQKWLNYEISNFTYLMMLNEFSGRSSNNIECYPVFPWVIDNNDVHDLDLSDTSVFRDLSKPIGALGQDRLSKLKFMSSNTDSGFLYHNMYSCSMNVLHYMVRLEPFTSAHIRFQDGKFDHPSRLFRSIPESYSHVKTSNNNFRELTPEFFFCADFLRNIDGFDIGTTSDGVSIGDVVLPNWSKTPEEFVYLHKKALESDYVSAHLSDWIDLIWGYKQSGPAARDSDNTFDPHLYQDVWQKFPDPNDSPMIESMLHHVGSIPRKLFDSPHKRRPPRKSPVPSAFTHFKVSDRPVISVKCVGDSTDKLLLFTLLDNGSVSLCRTSNLSVSQVSQVSRDSIDGSINICATGDSDSIFFVFCTSNSSDLFVVKSNCNTLCSKSSQHVESISSACIHGGKVITGGVDSILVEWSINDRGDLIDRKSIMAHADAILCCAASSSFGVVVSCSVDGLLVVSFLSDFSFIRSLDICLSTDHVANIVAVTEGIGLIVVCSSHSQSAVDGSDIIVHTLNGRRVSHISLPHRVTHMCTATNSSDIDYILAVVQSRVVVLFEAFNLREVCVVFRCDNNISHVGYDRSTDTVTIGDTQGNMFCSQLFKSVLC